MNLHEECLLKYLLNPTGLTSSTEILKQANELVIKKMNLGNILAKASKVGYITNRY
jgi:hypothetical protein